MKRNIILAIMCTVCTMTASAQGVGGVPTKGFAVFEVRDTPKITISA